jgi:hypothetical protein
MLIEKYGLIIISRLIGVYAEIYLVRWVKEVE